MPRSRSLATHLLLCATLVAACAPAPGPSDVTTTDAVASEGSLDVAPLDSSPADASPACSTMQALCSGVCVDTNSDPRNCGACGTACPSGQVCVSGACGLQCGPNQRVCNGGCVDLQTDRANCGACGAACAQGQVCALGACGVECGAGLALCGSAGDGGAGDGGASGRYCADTRTDNRNCGACGNACGAGRACVGGACAASCMAGLTDCSGSCRDLTYDPRNCGACGRSCPAGPGQTAVCASTSCGAVCSPGFLDCDGMAANGCEVSSTTDARNCGACGRVCSVANGNAACAMGACAVGTCATGYSDCNRAVADGCEANLASDPANCGACGTACGATELCLSGACTTINWVNSTMPSLVPGSAGCALVLDTNAHQLDLSPSGVAYLLLRCGTNARLTVSTDGARRWSAPVTLPLGTDADALQVFARTDSEVFVLAGLAAGSSMGQVRLLRSADQGTTFGASTLVGSGFGSAGPGPSVSMTARAGALFATWSGPGSTIPVSTSTDNGLTWAALPSITTLNFNYTSDLFFNTAGDLVLATEYNRAVLRLPSGAAAWSSVGALGLANGYTDFAAGGGFLFGSSDVAPVARGSIDTVSATTLLSSPVPMAGLQRSMDADSAGNLAFSVHPNSLATTRIHSWPASATGLDAGIDVPLAGTGPSAIAAIPTRRGSLTAISATGGVYTYVRVY